MARRVVRDPVRAANRTELLHVADATVRALRFELGLVPARGIEKNAGVSRHRFQKKTGSVHQCFSKNRFINAAPRIQM